MHVKVSEITVPRMSPASKAASVSMSIVLNDGRSTATSDSDKRTTATDIMKGVYV